ncbi:ATP-grasp domain-containing protein [Kitasatospora sp. NBC_01539]|uniref:ATP-grasp domain-containing protein n=1 Tax=Kitasatospora sp. NBC_01539 TaxID=2903577 RepID=UPI0038601F04
MSLLLLAPRINETGLRLLTSARRRGLRAHTATRWEVPAELAGLRPAHLYGGPLFADVASAALGVAPLEPPADWLTTLPSDLLGRRVECTTLAEARRLRRPAFVKPPVDKLFPARIYPDGSGLPGPDALDDDTPVLVSDIVAFTEEFRLFVLDGAVRAASRYAVDGALAVSPSVGPDARAFAADVLAACAHGGADGSTGSGVGVGSGVGLPGAVVVDIGRTADGWAVVEANPAWASGGYACDPDAVLDVVLRAAGPAELLTAVDAPFVRPVCTVVR